VYFRKTRYRPQDDVLDAGLLRGCDRNRIAVAAKTGGDPKYVYFLDCRSALRAAPMGDRYRTHGCSSLSSTGILACVVLISTYSFPRN